MSLVHLGSPSGGLRCADRVESRRSRGIAVQQSRRRAAAATADGGPAAARSRTSATRWRSTRAIRICSSIWGYAYWLDRDLPNAIQSLREAVRRRPADDAAHYVLGVALQMSGNAGEGARERELARRLSSEYAEWETDQPAPNTVPKGLERLKTDLTVPALVVSNPRSWRPDNATSRSSRRFTSMRGGARFSPSGTRRPSPRSAGRCISRRTTPRRICCLAGFIVRGGRTGRSRGRVHDLHLEPGHGRRAAGACRSVYPAAERARRPKRASGRPRAGSRPTRKRGVFSPAFRLNRRVPTAARRTGRGAARRVVRIM